MWSAFKTFVHGTDNSGMTRRSEGRDTRRRGDFVLCTEGVVQYLKKLEDLIEVWDTHGQLCESIQEATNYTLFWPCREQYRDCFSHTGLTTRSSCTGPIS